MLEKYINKLFQAWVKHNNIIIVVDYDDTLVPYDPSNQDICNDVVNTLKECQQYNAYIILYTCRAGERLASAEQTCKELGLDIKEVNPTTPFMPEYSNKPYCNIMLDDKAGLEEALKILKGALELYKIYAK